MTEDYELIPAIAELVLQRFSNGELGFAFPEVLTAVEVCTANSIAVLGVDLLEVVPDGLSTRGLLNNQLAWNKYLEQGRTWNEFVTDNNALALQYLRENLRGDSHMFLLTAVSRREADSLGNARI